MRDITIILFTSILLVLNSCGGRHSTSVSRHAQSSTAGSVTRNSASNDGKQNMPATTINSDNPVQSTSPNSGSSLPTSSNGVLTGKEIFDRYNSAVFMIYTSTQTKTSQGSGFFISSDGLAVSNYHVFQGTLKGYEEIKLTNGRTYRLASIVKQDEENDVFIFKVDIGNARVNCIPISNRIPSVGEKVYTIGSPKGLENTFSSGEISQLRDGNLIQINAPIDHGSSGGALFNEYGEIIGITSSGFDDSGANLNFAVDIKVVRNLMH